MKIQPQYSTCNSPKVLPFNGVHVIDTNVQKLLLTNLKPNQLQIMSELVKSQQENSVHVLLNSKNEKQLSASLMCEYRLQNFKTKYKQIPILESKFHFIKRVVNTANKYKKQIQNLEILKLKWDYPVLAEWVEKIFL